jgi:hypothetical protein
MPRLGARGELPLSLTCRHPKPESPSAANGQSFAETSVQTSSGTGTFSLKVTGLDTAATTSGNKVYFIHGTLDETLVPQAGGASGSVTVHASF